MTTTVRQFLFALLVLCVAPTTASADINPSYDFLEAIRENNVEEITTLIQKGVSPDTRTKKTGEAALVIATRIGNPIVIKMILDAGANPNIANREDGETALLQAALTGKTQIVAMLLDAGADPDITGASVETPLIRAVRGNKHRVAQALIKAGANPEIADATGNDAIHYASISRSRQIRSLFQGR